MPELPEIAALCAYVEQHALDRRISRVELAALSALKTYDPPITDLLGARLIGVERRGKFIVLEHVSEEGEQIYLATHLSRAGWLRWRHSLPTAPVKPGKGPMALRVEYVTDDGETAGGFELTEAGTQKRLAVYVTRDPLAIEGIARLGPDPLAEDFTLERFAEIIAVAGRTQVKGVLRDQSRIAGIGNAYSDEILHVAKLSPFAPCSSLDEGAVATVYAAMRATLTDAVERSVGQGTGDLKSEKRIGMRVHGRTGEKCPECVDVVREVSFADRALQYCATCQTGGTPLADRRMSKLLK